MVVMTASMTTDKDADVDEKDGDTAEIGSHSVY